MSDSLPWWHSLYDDLLANMLLENSSAEEIEVTLTFLQKALNLSTGDSIFDQCCGTGRLSEPLGNMGFKIYGVDLIPAYIETARSKLPKGTFEAADAFEYTCEPCDAALNWWTSFGYADEDQKNQEMLSCAFDSLKPGGRFALDYMNVMGLIHHFKPQVVTKSQHPTQGEVLLVRESRIDPTTGTLLKDWTYYPEHGDRVTHSSSVRLYDAPTLQRLFQEVGFVDISIVGDLDFSPLSIDSPRCIIIATRPKSK